MRFIRLLVFWRSDSNSDFVLSLVGHDEVAKLILSRGAIVDTAYSDGSPLHIAAFYGKTNVMKVLLEHHADVTDELYPSLLVFCV